MEKITDEQILKTRRIAVAGCSGIGVTCIETLARMGAERFLLAESQRLVSASRTDAEKHRAEVILERIRTINPDINGQVLYHGISQQNIEYFVGSSAIIVDGIDPSEPGAMPVKVKLHEESWRRQKVVVTCSEMAGTLLLRIYDYRKGKVKPLDGRFLQADLDGMTPQTFMLKMVTSFDLPLEVLFMDRKTMHKSRFHLRPMTDSCGVMCAWAVRETLAGRPVRRKVRIDISQKLRPRGTAWWYALKRCYGMFRYKVWIKRHLS